LLVEVTAVTGPARQFICGCPRITWVHRDSGDLERVALSASTHPAGD
jgi:hypothetical protein